MIMELCRGHLAKALVLVVIVAEPTINSGLHGLCVKPEVQRLVTLENGLT